MKQDKLNKRLYDAVSGNRISEIEQLLKQGADVNAQNKNGWTPLRMAVNKGFLEIVKLLIKNGADVNAKDEDGCTPLHEAIGEGCYDIAKLLIENGADVNAKVFDGWTPLHLAALWDKIDIVKVLIENGVDPFIKNKDGKTALDLCKDKAIREQLKKYMEDYESILEEITKEKEYSVFGEPLLDATYNSDLIEVKKCVFSGKYNIDVQDDKGYTPLMYAIMDHNFNIVEFLVKNGADINLCNFKGQSPLKIAYKYDDENIASYLLEKGAIAKLKENEIIDSVARQSK